MMGYCVFQFCQLLLAELDLEGSDVLFQVLHVLGAWNGEDIITLVVHPSQGQLSGLTTLLLCQLLQLVHKLLILHHEQIDQSAASAQPMLLLPEQVIKL